MAGEEGSITEYGLFTAGTVAGTFAETLSASAVISRPASHVFQALPAM